MFTRSRARSIYLASVPESQFFDILIANDDRTDNNLVVDRVKQPSEMQVFDHGECLLAGYRESGIARLVSERDEIGAVKKLHSGQERAHLLMPYLTTSKHIYEWTNRVDTLPRWFITEVCRNAIELGLTNDESLEVCEFLIHRKNTLVDIIHRNSGYFPLVTDWSH